MAKVTISQQLGYMVKEDGKIDTEITNKVNKLINIVRQSVSGMIFVPNMHWCWCEIEKAPSFG